MRRQTLVSTVVLIMACSAIMAIGLASANRPVRVLVLGDSIMYGKGQTVPWWTHLPKGHVVTNRAVSGATSADVLSEQVTDVRYDIAIIGVGRNDMNRDVPLSVYKANLKRIIQSCNARQIVVVTPPLKLGLPVSRQQQYTDAANSVFWPTVDLADAVPADERYYVDAGHPNSGGAKLIGQAIAQCLRELE